MLSYKKKILIDRTFGFVTVIVMRFLTRLVGIVLRRDHTLPENPKVVAVAKIVGLGSIVYTGILCRSIKERFPKTKLIYITSVGSLELVKRMNCIDEILLINDKNMISMIKSAGTLILKLWRYRPALYFDMEVYSSWAAIIATLSLALNRYGFYRKNEDFKKGMHTHMIFFNTKRHISEIYKQMSFCIGAGPNVNLSGLINILDEDRGKCLHKIKELEIKTSHLVLVNINASDLLIERRWPARKWKEYLEQTVKEFPGCRFLLIGSPNEYEYVSVLYNKLSAETQEQVFNVAGKFSFGAFLALIERSCLMVTNDSGPLHFAAALNIPTVSIWGPGDPEHYAPIYGLHKTIYESVYCSPCLYHADFPPCKGNNICVKSIEVSTVLNETVEILTLRKNNEGEKKQILSKNQMESDRNKTPISTVKKSIPAITHR